jgi:hypothetical protein
VFMRLSEAIRLGSLLGPQAFGTLADMLGGTCALGSAAKAMGIQITTAYEAEDTLKELFPIFECEQEPPVPMPVVDLYTIIMELNDAYRWSRERIADWVEFIEKAEEAKTGRVLNTDPISEPTAPYTPDLVCSLLHQ